MINCLNKVFILGFLGYDPEFRYLSNGNSFVSLFVVTKSFNKDSNFYRNDWHRVLLYNKLSENYILNLKKNDYVYVEGFLKNNKWQDKNGIFRYSTDIVSINFQVIFYNLEQNKVYKKKTFNNKYNDIPF